MARPLRIEFAGAWYHVMNRGAGRCQIFPDDFMRRQFLLLLEALYVRYGVCCHAFCLMGNHYHLLLQTLRANLGRAMRHLDGVYTQRHNRHVDTDGPLFRGRYAAQLVERDSYFLSVSRYVHRNPVEAGLCDRLTDYPWSSYPCFAQLRSAPYWLHTAETIANFESTRDYCAFVEAKSCNKDLDRALRSLSGRYLPVLGSEAFTYAMQKRVTPDFEIPQSRALHRLISLDEIVDLVCAQSALAKNEILAPANQRARRQRAIAMLLAQQYSACSLQEIAGSFDMGAYTTAASAIARCRESAAREPAVADALAVLHKRIAKMQNE